MRTVMIVHGDAMGVGDPALGAKILGTCLRTLVDVEPRPDVIVLYNAAVKLMAQGSPVLDALKALDERGVRLVGCVTCIEHFALADRIAVGKIGNMREIVGELAKAEKVITL